jgi:hypothetical protein
MCHARTRDLGRSQGGNEGMGENQPLGQLQPNYRNGNSRFSAFVLDRSVGNKCPWI